MNLVKGITPGRPLVCSDKGRHLCNNLLLHLSVLSESMCFFFLSEYFCTQMILVFVWPEGHILHSLQCISLEERQPNKQANEVNRFAALPPIRKPMNGLLPKQGPGCPLPGSSSHQVSHTTPTKKEDWPLEQQTLLTTPVPVCPVAQKLSACLSVSLFF